MPQGEATLTPSELTRSARVHIESRFGDVRVTGELSNFRRPSSGHWYFSIKDDKAQVRCAMFVNRNRFAKLQPRDGLAVVLRGRVSLYEARGDFQIIVEHIEAAGEGALRLAYEALLKQLHAEGLTSDDRKRPLPAIPQRICVITSATGAALQDLFSVLGRRYPLAEVVVIDVAVQGAESEPQVVRAIERAPETGADVVIITRGGGSLEDLWTFNTERVARALASCPIPTVSAIGHEIDVAITDYVADVRAATPSAAAELCTPHLDGLRQHLDQTQATLARQLALQLARHRARLAAAQARLVSPSAKVAQWVERTRDLQRRLLRAMAHQQHTWQQALTGHQRVLLTHHPSRKVAALKQDIERVGTRASIAMQGRLRERQRQLTDLARTLNAVSPLATVARGYAVLTDEGGDAVTTTDQTNPGSTLHAHLSDGRLEVEVRKVEPGAGLIRDNPPGA